MKPLKVLHLVHAFRTGGAERVLVHLCNGGDPAIHNIIASLAPPDDFQLQIREDRRDVRWLQKRAGNDWRVLFRIRSLIIDEQVDVVHIQGWGVYLEGVLAALLVPRRRPRLVFAFHGKTVDDVKHGIALRRKVAQRLACYFTDAIIAPARHMAAEYASTIGIPEKRVTVIYNGIDAETFSMCYPNAREELSIYPDRFVVGFVGRLDPVKNLLTTLRMFQKFREGAGAAHRDRVLLLLVGDGPERGVLQREAEALGIARQVRFAGQRPDIGRCLAAMDVYLQPSLYEGHSFTILEAMAAGLPVITSRVGGNPEIIRHEKNGFLCDPGDVEGAAYLLLNLLQNPHNARRVGESASRSILEKFDRTAMVRKYHEIFFAA